MLLYLLNKLTKNEMFDDEILRKLLVHNGVGKRSTILNTKLEMYSHSLALFNSIDKMVYSIRKLNGS